ncbi:39S ribosomal protein L13, mitochondrial [Schistosoma japonicum]|nr:39S ribosomal protein L13, mitochondrial [Schistosoma japonicum]
MLCITIISKFKQWRAFAKEWLIYDAFMQCPMLSAERIAKYLMGKHIRYYDPASDFGAHVVVINSRYIAAKDNSRYWRRFIYTSHTRFPVNRVEETMGEIHQRDPTEVIRLETKAILRNNESRKYQLFRLHIYPENIETVPKDIIANVSGVIPQVMRVPKRLDEYSPSELKEFPKLFDWLVNHVMNVFRTDLFCLWLS